MRRPVGPGPGRTRTLLTASPRRTQATASRPCDRPRHGPKSGHWPARSRRKQVRGVRGSGGIPGTGAGLGPAGGGGVAASATRWLLDTIGASARWRAEGGRGGAGQGPRLVTYLTQIKPSWSNYFSAWRRAEGGRGGPGARLPPVRAESETRPRPGPVARAGFWLREAPGERRCLAQESRPRSSAANRRRDRLCLPPESEGRRQPA